MTTPPTTPHDRLRAELDRRLAVARAATPPPWEVDGVTVMAGPIHLIQPNTWFDPERNAAHIALHDPADAIRRYDGELEVLQRHQSRAMVYADNAPSVSEPNECWRCHVAWPCPEILLLASRLGVNVDG